MQACAVRLQGVHFGEIRVEWLFLGLLASLGFQGARAVRAQEQVLVEVGEEWRYFKGTQAPPANW